MRIVSNKYFVLIVFLFGSMGIVAQGPSGPKFPPPPGEILPIDDNLYVLLGGALLLGVYVIYKNKLKTKTPM